MAAPLAYPFDSPDAAPFEIIRKVKSFQAQPIDEDGRTALLVVLQTKAHGVLVGAPDSISSLKLFEAKGSASPAGLAPESWLVGLRPELEWRALFRDSWRMMRDYFYDPDMHGNDVRVSHWLPLLHRP